jgi:flagella basal body P-ring formation protein FlgA
VTDLPTPAASRLQLPSWRDSRLVVGVLLVMAATALGSRVVAAADDTVPMYAAAATLVPGEPVTQDDVRVVRVRLAPSDAAYLPADRELGADHYMLREVRPGELVTRSALGTAAT